ncbi:hypothetical protein CapIbe_022252 [Capra ibex]
MGLPLARWTPPQTTGILWKSQVLQGGKGQGASQKLDLESSFQGGLSSCQEQPQAPGHLTESLPPSGPPDQPVALKGGRRLLPELQNLKALGFLGAALRHTPCQA